jgi:hypothetical protein
MEDPMPNREVRRDEGILVLRPDGPLAASDFIAAAGRADAYPEQQGTLRGVLIHENALRSWNDFEALLARLQSIRQRHRLIEKVAVVADRGFATVVPFIASHFIRAQVKHFDRAHEENAAWDWLVDDSRSQMHTAA